jgi:hypothetical protein
MHGVGALLGRSLSPWLGARVLSLGVAVSAALAMAAGPWIASLGNGGACAYRVSRGRPCLGCGGTHAFRRAVTGDMTGAARLNLLGAFAGAAVWLMLIGGIVGAVAGRVWPVVAACLAVAATTPIAAAAAWIRWVNLLPKPWP